MSQSEDLRCFAPATERNREPIYQVLKTVLPPTGTVLEIASGTGQHAVFLAPRLTARHWLPSDPNPTARASIQSWRTKMPVSTLHEPLDLDVGKAGWEQLVIAWQRDRAATVPPIHAIVNINMIHISPWSACEGLFAGAETLLSSGHVLYLYGPFKRDGQHTAPSNEAFDQSLRSQNSAWGVRDLSAVIALAEQHRFHLTDLVPMPANNFSVVFTQQ